MRHLDKLFEREIEEIEADYSAGLITKEQYLQALKEVRRDYKDALEEEVDRYRNSIDDWY